MNAYIRYLTGDASEFQELKSAITPLLEVCTFTCKSLEEELDQENILLAQKVVHSNGQSPSYDISPFPNKKLSVTIDGNSEHKLQLQCSGGDYTRVSLNDKVYTIHYHHNISDQ